MEWVIPLPRSTALESLKMATKTQSMLMIVTEKLAKIGLLTYNILVIKYMTSNT